MDKVLVEKSIREIIELINKKQFLSSEKKARLLINSLNTSNKFEYKIFVKANILLIESLSRSARNLVAIEVLEKVTQNYPYEEQFLNILYNLYVKLKRVQKAENLLKNLIDLKPEDINLRNQLVNLFIERNENIKAITELRKIISLGTTDSTTRKMLISILEKEGILFEKINEIKILQELNPLDMSLIIEEINTLISIRNFNEAIEKINGLINYKIGENQIDVEIISILNKFSDIYLKTGNRDLLAKTFIKILKKKDFNTLPVEFKLKMHELSRSLKIELIFRFYTNSIHQITQKPVIKTLAEKVPQHHLSSDVNDILFNIMTIANNEGYNNDVLSLISKPDILNQIPKDKLFALFTIINLRRA